MLIRLINLIPARDRLKRVDKLITNYFANGSSWFKLDLFFQRFIKF
jgi:hypothetical protein